MLAKKIVLNQDLALFFSGETDKNEATNTLTPGQKWAVLGSGIIGALAYTFTDSFWFSAVEGEVYAMSSFFTALVVWAILKWEAEITEKEFNPEDEDLKAKNENRWLVFIFFMIGLSIGVHLLNLLSIPAIAYVIYFKKFKKPEPLGFIVTGVVGVIALGLIQAFIIPKSIQIAGFFERVFRNQIGLPFNSGTIFFFLTLLGVIIGALYLTHKHKKYLLNVVAWSFTMIFVGYSCFAMIVIRSNANTPLDENDPENLVSLEAYLKREQYGDWPILYGQYFNANLVENRSDWNNRSDVYLRRFVVQSKNGKKDLAGFVTSDEAEAYKESHGGVIIEKYYKTYSGKNQKPTYEAAGSTFFPRMYSSEARHVNGYKNWSNYSGNKRLVELNKDTKYIKASQQEKLKMQQDALYPTFGENLTYFASYQFNWMYWRYFMWNFSGRQSDEQGHGNARDGNWISGINFIDQHHIGDQTNAPKIITENPSHNKFFMLPLLLGIIGFVFTLTRASKTWWIVTLLFLLTGVAIIIYLNQKPMEPRERDYAYAGSFYAFSFWIGLSVLALYDAFKNMKWKDLGIIAAVFIGSGVILTVANKTTGVSLIYLGGLMVGLFALMIALRTAIKNDVQISYLATLIFLPVPILMGMQGWDDHSRANRYTAQALAENYLSACSKNSIIFTNGDNDTFPLWYLQEVEGKKTSVRVCNLSLLNTDWYTTQMKRKAYDSDPLPISFKESQYRQNMHLDFMYVQGTTDLLFSGMTSSINTQAIIKMKIESNPELFAQGFNTAVKDLYNILSRSALAQSNPELVNTLIDFDKKGSYDSYQKFILQLLQNGNSYGLTEQEIQAIQSNLIRFNDSFDYLPVDYVMDFLKNESNLIDNNGNKLFIIPTKGLSLKVNKEKVKELALNDDPSDDVVAPKDLDRVLDVMRWKLPKNTLYKADLLILDMVANFNWERNIYFAGSAAQATYMGLEKFFYTEGLVYKLVPVSASKNLNPNSLGEIDKEGMYNDLMVNYHWGNMKEEGVLIDYYTRRLTNNYRVQFSVLADAYVEEYENVSQTITMLESVDVNQLNPTDTITLPSGKYVVSELATEKQALEVQKDSLKSTVVSIINKSLVEMPTSKVPFDRIIPYYISAFYSVGAIDEGDKLTTEAIDAYQDEMDYYLSIDVQFSAGMLDDMYGVYRSLFTIYQLQSRPDANEEIAAKTADLISTYKMQIESKKGSIIEVVGSERFNSTFGAFFNQLDQMMMYQN